MFQPGEYIHYATSGLCRVEEITTLQMSGADSARLYYRLTPVYGHGSTIFTPVDNPKVAMRRAMTAKEADALIASIPQIEELAIPEEKHREQSYKDALMSVDCRNWVQVIKTLYNRRQNRLAQGRKVTSTDERYMRSAQERLYTELAVALGKEREEMEDYISSVLD